MQFDNKNLRRIILISIVLCVFYFYHSDKERRLQLFNSADDNQSVSPFRNTLGFIRWNSPHNERIPLMEKYRPFFAQLHYSIPNKSSNLTLIGDGWESSTTEYKAVADTMYILLQDHPTIEGLLYFHFDAWINPFKFDNLNFRHIWFPDSPLPPFRCVQNTSGWDWWAWNFGYHLVALKATERVARNYSKRFVTDARTFCGGWSDIYYIPRCFFQDFIDLSNVFYEVQSFHEVAIPTMINIIDLTRRKTPFLSIITRLNDCWGDCCAGGSKPEHIKQKRCGHRMDLARDDIRQTLIEILESEAVYLTKNK